MKGVVCLNRFEFLKEEQNLEITLNLLSKEILNYIQKRKDVADYILEYRKKFIEEYRDDEDKVMERLSWSDFVLGIEDSKKALINYLKEKRLYVNEEKYEEGEI